MIFLLLKKYVTTLNIFRLNIIKFWTKFCNKLDCKLKLQLHSIYIYIYIFDVNFDKSTIELHFFSYILHACRTSIKEQ